MDHAMRSDAVGPTAREAEPDAGAAEAAGGGPLATVATDPPAASGEQLEGWGRVPMPGRELRSEDLERITAAVPLTRGLARSYGDSSLPAPGDHVLAATPLADRILAFDPVTGRIRAEAGLSLHALNRVMLPRCWFPPVTPGTQYVTVGGMVASDVHGKNHHVEGCFGEHVSALRMRVADGRILECSPDEHSDLFWATVGGMGLTGHILEVEFGMRRIPTPWIWQESERVPDIDAYCTQLEENAKSWPMTFGWIDCLSQGSALGRGVLQRGRWAEPGEAPSEPPQPKRRISMPLVLPQLALNRVSMRLANFLIYHRQLRRLTRGIVHPETFFYPLDTVLHWNRMYGPRGFTQFQCVLPREAGRAAARNFLELLSSKGGASFLCVIKDCGAQGRGMLSFPREGISIALDIPVRPGTQAIVDALNERVIELGGRIYLTKDGFTRREHFAAMEPRLAAFEAVRRRWDPEGRLRSAQSVRVLGDRPATDRTR
jgi:decaprenylphospho-beta-D-ribofuranose 2-oxidase